MKKTLKLLLFFAVSAIILFCGNDVKADYAHDTSPFSYQGEIDMSKAKNYWNTEYSTEYAQFLYSIENNEVTILCANAYAFGTEGSTDIEHALTGTIEVPSKIEGYPVTKIREYGFSRL